MTVELLSDAQLTGTEVAGLATAPPKPERAATVSFETLFSEQADALRDEEEDLPDEAASAEPVPPVVAGNETLRPVFPPTYFFTEWQVQQLAGQTDDASGPGEAALVSGAVRMRETDPESPPGEGAPAPGVGLWRLTSSALGQDCADPRAGVGTHNQFQTVVGRDPAVHSEAALVLETNEHGSGWETNSHAGTRLELDSGGDGAVEGLTHEQTPLRMGNGHAGPELQKPEAAGAISQVQERKPAALAPVGNGLQSGSTNVPEAPAGAGADGCQVGAGVRASVSPEEPGQALGGISSLAPKPLEKEVGLNFNQPPRKDEPVREAELAGKDELPGEGRMEEPDKAVAVVSGEAAGRLRREEFERHPPHTGARCNEVEAAHTKVHISDREEHVGSSVAPPPTHLDVRREQGGGEPLAVGRPVDSSRLEAIEGRPSTPASAVQLAVTGDKGEDVQATVRLTQQGVEVRIQTRAEGLQAAIAQNTPYLKHRLEDVQRTDFSDQWSGMSPASDRTPQPSTSTADTGQGGRPGEDARSGGGGRERQPGEGRSQDTADGRERNGREEEFLKLLEGTRKP